MRYILAALVTLLASAGWAAGDLQSSATPGEAVRFFKDSAGYHISTPNGKEMTLYEYVRTPQAIKITLKQIENTCIPDQELADCSFNLDFAPYHYVFVWTKHPEIAKVGTMVEGGKASRYATFYSTFAYPRLAPLFKPDRLSCTNYQWTQGMQKSADGSLLVNSWSAESMLPNNESGVNENQTGSNGFDILLKANSANELEVRGVKSDYQRFGFESPPYLSTQVSNINFVSTKNEICQVSFESSIGNAVSIITGPYFTEVDQKGLKLTTDIYPGLYLDVKFLVIGLMQNLKMEGGR